VHACTHTHTCTHAKNTHKRTRIYRHARAYTRVRTLTLNTRTHTHTHTCARTHTHTHTHTRRTSTHAGNSHGLLCSMIGCSGEGGCTPLEVSLHGACVVQAQSWAAQADEPTHMDAGVHGKMQRFHCHHENRSQLSHINLHPHFRCRKGAVCRAACPSREAACFSTGESPWRGAPTSCMHAAIWQLTLHRSLTLLLERPG